MNATPIYVLIAALGLGLLLGWVVSPKSGATGGGFLMVQTAQGGTFEAAGGDDASHYILTLQGVSPVTTYFSDRPQRITGSMSTENFVGGWGFPADSQPNAAVVLASPESSDQDVIVGVFSNPKYDSGTHTLSYDVRVLTDVATQGLEHLDGQHDASLPASFGEVSLFIDNSVTVTVVATHASDGSAFEGVDIKVTFRSRASSPQDNIDQATDSNGKTTFSLGEVFDLKDIHASYQQKSCDRGVSEAMGGGTFSLTVKVSIDENMNCHWSGR